MTVTDFNNRLNITLRETFLLDSGPCKSRNSSFVLSRIIFQNTNEMISAGGHKIVHTELVSKLIDLKRNFKLFLLTLEKSRMQIVINSLNPNIRS